jgi:hypothetical protein
MLGSCPSLPRLLMLIWPNPLYVYMFRYE